jgi:N-acetyl sugar amidotransferase
MMKGDGYRVCERCVMDTTVPEIVFYEDGNCNYCTGYLENRNRYLANPNLDQELDKIVAGIKKDGAGKKYDCIIGVSGGTDSTYVAYVVKKLGLRPLAVHLDNGWNSELAVSNIEKTMKEMGIDLYTHVLDWNEFKDIQIAFLRSSTPDMELPSDHAIRTILLHMAKKMKVKYIVNGRNFSTEGILPVSWSYGPFDWKYLKSVHKQFGSVAIRTYPHLTLLSLFYHYAVRGIKDVNILNYVKYEKKAAMEILKGEIGWRDYGGKHYESIFTRFYQAYILPVKFNIDKRRAHYSVLVASGQISREMALSLLDEPTYDPTAMDEDKRFFIKKLDMTEEEFQQMLQEPVKSYQDYPNNAGIFLINKKNRYIKIFRILRLLRGGTARMVNQPPL